MVAATGPALGRNCQHLLSGHYYDYLHHCHHHIMTPIIPLAPLQTTTHRSRPGMLASLPMLLVLSHWDEDLSWCVCAHVHLKKNPRTSGYKLTNNHSGPTIIRLKSQPWPAVIYEKKPPFNITAGLHGVPRNVAGEATAFLKFIHDYYNTLPERYSTAYGHKLPKAQRANLCLRTHAAGLFSCTPIDGLITRSVDREGKAWWCGSIPSSALCCECWG